jgi:hypothetical protein
MAKRHVKPGMCKCECGRSAESRTESRFRLSATCAGRLYPRADEAAYRQLVAAYGYDQAPSPVVVRPTAGTVEIMDGLTITYA